MSRTTANECISRSFARKPIAIENQTVGTQKLSSQTTVATVKNAIAFFDVVTIGTLRTIEIHRWQSQFRCLSENSFGFIQYTISGAIEDASVQIALISIVIVEKASRTKKLKFATTDASEKSITASGDRC